MMRKSLGRGLDALIESVGVTGDSGAPALLMVAPDRIVASPFQPRRHFDPEKLRELTDAIRSQGIIEPLIVRPVASDLDAPRYQLIAGERRLRASREAGLELIPVVVREVDDNAALEMSLVENLVREDLNPIEEARAFVRLNREFNLSHEEIAARIGKSRPYVSNTMRLLELPIPVVEMITHGRITPGQARPLLVLGSADDQITAASRIVEGKLSARVAEQIVGERKAVGLRGGRSGRHAPADANLSALTESIQKALRRKVRIARQRGKKPGRIELEYYNDEDLTTIARILTVAGRAVHGDV